MDPETMFDVEPQSWEETATRLQAEKLALRAERDHYREALEQIDRETRHVPAGFFHHGIIIALPSMQRGQSRRQRRRHPEEGSMVDESPEPLPGESLTSLLLRGSSQ